MARIDEAMNRINEAVRIGYRNLFEAMSYADAKAIFAQHGVDVGELDEAGLKKAFRKLAMQHHPDQGGDENVLKNITAAYAVLEKGSNQPQPGATYRSYGAGAGQDFNTDGDYPVWANAGYSGGMRHKATIRREDYTDLNYLKRQMWRLSNQSRTEWTIWTFDGAFFRSSVSVYGSPEIFPEMAKAVLQWEDPYYSKNAVFVCRKNSKELLLIWLDGEDVVPPVPMEHESFNLNPGNDKYFVRELPEKLAEVKNRLKVLTKSAP